MLKLLLFYIMSLGKRGILTVNRVCRLCSGVGLPAPCTQLRNGMPEEITGLRIATMTSAQSLTECSLLSLYRGLMRII